MPASRTPKWRLLVAAMLLAGCTFDDPLPYGTGEGVDLSSLPPDTEPWILEIVQDLSAQPDPNPVNVSIELDTERSVERVVGVEGGRLELEGPGGEVYLLELPDDALLSEALITMTAVSAIDEATADGQTVAAVMIRPTKLALLRPAALTIRLPEEADLSGYLGFAGTEAGENVYAVPSVEASGGILLHLPHFSLHGVVSGRHSPGARLLRAAITNNPPAGAAEYNETRVVTAWADWLEGAPDQQASEAVTAAKLDWFWRPGDGVYWTVLDAALGEAPVELAIAHFLAWWRVGVAPLTDIYGALGTSFPFDRELARVNELITTALKEGLDEVCTRPIEALERIRYYRLGQVLQSNPNDGLSPYSGEFIPEFTESYALNKAQACARFDIEFTSILSAEDEFGSFTIKADADRIPFVFGEPYEFVELFVTHDPPITPEGPCAWSIRNGVITVEDIRWPLNFLLDPDFTFKENPLEIRLRNIDGPMLLCEGSDEFTEIEMLWSVGRWLCPMHYELRVDDFERATSLGFGEEFKCLLVDIMDSEGTYYEEVILTQDPAVWE